MVILGGLGILLGAVFLFTWIRIIFKGARLSNMGFSSRGSENNYVWVLIPLVCGLISSYGLYSGSGDYAFAGVIIFYVVVLSVLLSMDTHTRLVGVRNFRYWFRDLYKVLKHWDLDIDVDKYNKDKLVTDEVRVTKRLREVSKRFNYYVDLVELKQEIESLGVVGMDSSLLGKRDKLNEELAELSKTMDSDRDFVVRVFGLRKKFSGVVDTSDVDVKDKLNKLDKLY